MESDRGAAHLCVAKLLGSTQVVRSDAAQAGFHAELQNLAEMICTLARQAGPRSLTRAGRPRGRHERTDGRAILPQPRPRRLPGADSASLMSEICRKL